MLTVMANLSTSQNPQPALATKWESIWDGVWRHGGSSAGVTLARNIYNALLERLFEPRLTPQTKLLELGCGTATLTLSLAPKIHSLVGIDISDVGLLLARSNQKKMGVTNAHFVKADARQVPYRAEFDLVWSAGLIEHFFEHDIDIVRQHLAATKPGGTVLLSVPYAYSLHRLHYLLTRPAWLRRFWPWSQERNFQQFYSHRSLARVARQTGLPFRVFLLLPAWFGLLLGIIILEIKKPK